MFKKSIIDWLIKAYYPFNLVSEKLFKYFGYFEIYVSDPKNIHANETVSGGKLEKPEIFPNQLKPSTDFNEMQKIMRSRKTHTVFGFNEKKKEWWNEFKEHEFRI